MVNKTLKGMCTVTDVAQKKSVSIGGRRDGVRRVRVDEPAV
jgi:hypothetical protein